MDDNTPSGVMNTNQCACVNAQAYKLPLKHSTPTPNHRHAKAGNGRNPATQPITTAWIK